MFGPTDVRLSGAGIKLSLTITLSLTCGLYWPTTLAEEKCVNPENSWISFIFQVKGTTDKCDPTEKHYRNIESAYLKQLLSDQKFRELINVDIIPKTKKQFSEIKKKDLPGKTKNTKFTQPSLQGYTVISTK